MKMTMKQMLMAAACAAVMTGTAEGTKPIEDALPPAEGWSPVGFAFAPVRYLQFPGSRDDMNGFGFGLIAGHYREVNGVDFGAFGNWADGELNGLACAGLGNCCDGASFGVHLASAVNYAEGPVNGCQLAMVNSAFTVSGLQFGLVNCVSEGSGCQVGAWNLAESWHGVQFGLVNMAMNYSGIQIGLGNIIGESPLTACVFFNAWF